jgi:hypothetical protein
MTIIYDIYQIKNISIITDVHIEGTNNHKMNRISDRYTVQQPVQYDI